MSRERFWNEVLYWGLVLWGVCVLIFVGYCFVRAILEL